MSLYTSRISKDLFVAVSALILVALVDSKQCKPKHPCMWVDDECRSNAQFTVARCAPGKICRNYEYLKRKSEVCPSGYTLHKTARCKGRGNHRNYRHFCCHNSRNYTVTGLPYLTPKDYENQQKHPPKVGQKSPIPHNPVHPNRTKSVYVYDNRWPYAEIPYEISSSGPGFTEEQRTEITRAIDNYERNTCLIFYHKTDDDEGWVTIKNDPEVNTETNCGLSIICGPWGGSQYSSVGPPCANAEWFVHELGHSLCLGHEHQRGDRDTYIYFNSDVCSADTYPLLTGFDWDSQGLDFDYKSIMMYPGCYPGACFQRQPGHGRGPCGEPGDGSGRLSTLDIIRVNLYYNCDCRFYNCG